jgi:hypothetical protein
MLHITAEERYQKLKKVYHRLLFENFNRDDLDDFFQVANALPSCIELDPVTSPAQKEHAERLRPGMDWIICKQIANQQKHFKPDIRSGPKQALVKSVQRKLGATGFLDLSHRRVLGAGEQILMELYNGSEEDALGMVYRMFRHFEYIFETLPAREKACYSSPFGSITNTAVRK